MKIVEIGVGGCDNLGPVIIKAQFLQLVGEGSDILLSKAIGMVAGIHSVLLRGQTEGVIAHGMQNIEALHTLHAGHDVGSGIAFGMTCVQTNTGRIREHIQNVVLRLGEIPHIGSEGVVFLPIFMPLLFNGGKIVIHW